MEGRGWEGEAGVRAQCELQRGGERVAARRAGGTGLIGGDCKWMIGRVLLGSPPTAYRIQHRIHE